VADVFDALISERPYKRPWAPDAAMEELQRIAGSQLDPDVVAAFADLYRRGVIDRISQELGESEQVPSLGQVA
jgi:HD-GYP domain-containing protein (c-di-GMP phosphodiesterase class II)